ncbi:response regulator transcription factor [Salinimicrobium sp. TIG7-5_MAKvit]|uniref:LytR/AlgR family response regulator transcription factor n=1 Tax=Salinimicrobium sp. TIG7-5_MAKvit TaxID=3121289 RepID=UPI003C6E1034
MNLKCIIIDDEPLAINVIKNHLSQFKDVSISATFNNAVESLKYLENSEVDLLFLDINMPVLDGYSLLKSLSKKPMVIITTAHAEFAVQSYELEVLDYLVKPISFPRFVKAMNKALKRKQTTRTVETTSEKDHIFIKMDKKLMKKIYLDDIKIVESLKDYIRIITTSGKYIVHQTLSNFTDSLPADKFIRIHRSFTISLDKVEAIEGNCLQIDGNKYTIGRSYLNDVKETLLKTY